MKKTEQIEPQHTAIFVTTSREEGEKKTRIVCTQITLRKLPPKHTLN